MKETQRELVLNYLEQFGSITILESIRDLGVTRLSARIAELKQMGYPIESKPETVVNRFGKKCYVKRYSLVKENEHD